LCAGLAAARIDRSEKHRSPTRNTPQALAFRGTDAKEFPILETGTKMAKYGDQKSIGVVLVNFPWKDEESTAA
jgi:hypothetical protein